MAIEARECGLPTRSCSACCPLAIGQSRQREPTVLGTRHPVLGCISPGSRLEKTSGGNTTVYVIQMSRPDNSKALLLLQCMTISSLIFFMLGFETHQSKKEAKKLLWRALMLTCFATLIPCKLMKASLGTSGYMAGGALLCTVIQLYLTAPSPQPVCLSTPQQQACSWWVPGEMSFLPGAHFGGLFNKETARIHHHHLGGKNRS